MGRPVDATLRGPGLRPPVGRARRPRPRHRGGGLESGRCASPSSRRPGLPLPPTGYGGIEWIVSLLADGLDRPRPRRHALRLGRLPHEGRARRDLRRGAERADRAVVHGSAARALVLRAGGGLRHHQRPHRPARRRARRALEAARRAHGPRPARRRRRARSTSRSGRCPPGRADLDLARTSAARARPELGREHPERDRSLALPVQAPPRRLPALPRPDERGQGRAPRGRGRDGARAAAQARREDARDEGARVLRGVRRAAPRRHGSSTSAR